MRSSKPFLFGFLALMAVAGFALKGLLHQSVNAAPNNVLLTGAIKSESSQAMGGVTVSAEADGTHITTSVFTDEQGNYYFPPLEPAKYHVWAQAVGYQTAKGDVDLNGIQHQDFVLKTNKDFIRQMTGEQFVTALPEDTADDRRLKQVFRDNCTDCHEPNYILRNRFDAQGWTAIMNLMRRISFDGSRAGIDAAPNPVIQYHEQELAAYLARMRGPGDSPMQFKPRPRPSGDAARAVFIEYDIPLDTPEGGYSAANGSDWSLGDPSRLNDNHGPHDSVVDLNGNMWFTDNWPNTVRTIGMINAKTGEFKNFRVEGQNGLAAATHGMTRDAQGILWFNVSMVADAEGEQGGSLGRVDPNTGKIQVFTPPKGMAGVGGTLDVAKDGSVWAVTNAGALRFNPKTEEFTEFKNVARMTPDGPNRNYGMAVDADGNGWWTLFGADRLEKADIHTGKVTEIKLDQVPGQADMITPEERKLYQLEGSDAPWAQEPRRMGSDKNGNLVWVADWSGGNLARVDIHSMKVTYIPLPNPNVAPYGTTVDINHKVWVPFKNSDQIAKYDPDTNQWTLYDLPTLGADLRYASILDRDGKVEEVVASYSKTSKVTRLTFRSKEDMQALRTEVQRQEQARLQ